jgi:hypothetical protein
MLSGLGVLVGLLGYVGPMDVPTIPVFQVPPEAVYCEIDQGDGSEQTEVCVKLLRRDLVTMLAALRAVCVKVTHNAAGCQLPVIKELPPAETPGLNGR